MNLLSAEGLTHSFGDRYLFRRTAFGISKGEKIALIGANGAGKSTLMKILAGIFPPQEGIVSVRKGCRVAYLAQEPALEPELSILENVLQSSRHITQLINKYEALIVSDNPDEKALNEAMEEMEKYNAWDFDVRAREMLSRFGLKNHEQKAGSLSGGERKRVAFSALLLQQPDLILLDEPTNHLDLETIEWLEAYLNTENTTLIMVTHDRYFLDNITNVMVELNGGILYRYEGNYAHFLEKRAEREANAIAVADKAKNLLRKELDWMRRQPKARGTKAKYRIEAFHELKEKAASRPSTKEMQINMKAGRIGSKILEIENACVSFGDKTILENFSYVFKKQDSIGIVGKNGAGKTTFLNLMTGQLPPTSGTITPGETLKIGYYTQHTDDLNPENRVIEEIQEIADYISLPDGSQVSASKMLEMFLFAPAVQYTPVAKLSGGERRRLQLLKVLMKQPNFLVLDEPTNDLDLDTLDVLEEFLESFDGCLVLVSHDRFFLDSLTDHLFVLTGNGQVRDFPGNYSEWREAAEEEAAAILKRPVAPEKSKQPVQAPATNQKRKLSFKEQKELETLENDLSGIELRKQLLAEKMSGASVSHENLMTWGKEMELLNSESEEKTMRWLELSE